MVELLKCDKCGVVQYKASAEHEKPTIRCYAIGPILYHARNPVLDDETATKYDLCQSCHDSLENTIQQWFNIGEKQ